MPDSNNIEYDVIAEEEIYEEITYKTNFYDTTNQSENNWRLLNKYDLLPYNEIHKRVQNDIWHNFDNNVQTGELRINYKNVKKSEKGTKGTYGFADVYGETFTNHTEQDIIYCLNYSIAFEGISL